MGSLHLAFTLYMNITEHFTWHEMLYLPSWQVEHIPSEDEKTNLLKLANKMEEIRTLLGKSINVHVTLRPILNNPDSPHNTEDYNKAVKGATHSAHKVGLAMDWDCGEDCDVTREFLVPHLEALNVRMEQNKGGNWVHIDLIPPNPNRYFIP